MAITYTGTITGPLANLRNLIADCDAFRAWTGTATQAAARARCHFVSQVPGRMPRPHVMLGLGDGWRREKHAEGVPPPFRTVGGYWLRFEDIVNTAYEGNPAQEALAFINAVEAIEEEMEGKSGGNDGSFRIGSIAPTTPTPFVSAHEEGEKDLYFLWEWIVDPGWAK